MQLLENVVVEFCSEMDEVRFNRQLAATRAGLIVAAEVPNIMDNIQDTMGRWQAVHVTIGGEEHSVELLASYSRVGYEDDLHLVKRYLDDGQWMVFGLVYDWVEEKGMRQKAVFLPGAFVFDEADNRYDLDCVDALGYFLRLAYERY